ncbi:MAG: hypothetical protein F6K14_01950 [Symploca sp. SIO2C1]|nr:hypothetical protein [Symploca sp. SIO2C1]
MTVVSGKKVVFCEGKQISLDYRLLNRVVENLGSDQPTIIPTGGKFTFSIFAEGYFFPNELEYQQYIFFRDRDFDTAPSEDTKLLPLVNARDKIFAFSTHRACVENYLLDAKLIHLYWSSKYIEKQENSSSKWGHKNSPGVENIAKWIETSAEKLQNYQAVRWALADLLQMSTARAQLKTTWTGGSGKLPSSLTQEDCQSRAIELICEFRKIVEMVTEESFEKSLDKYQNQFNQAEFWTNKQYLIWFHGKDLKKMMQKQELSYISLDKFFNWAITQLDITQHSDLMELRTRIDQL